jgi:chromate reductase, NAD(P)H dehydrogenase (quinone)
VTRPASAAAGQHRGPTTATQIGGKKLKILTICGSLRANSYNAALVRALPELAPADMEFVSAPPFHTMPFYNADIQDASGFPGSVSDFAAAVRSADGVIFVAPEYNWTIPGALKNALEWVSRVKDQPFRDKPVAFQSATQGPLGGARMQYHLRMCMTSLNAFIFGTPEVFVGMAQDKFDQATLKLTDEQTRRFVALQLQGFAGFIARLRM